ncbi:MAG: carbohydrate ABC transporter permease [Hamadaea sp.]|uniref:carbohydrate ABC transporter permease n=1 Tax=Hamadaea sp. TaxID=2024425 RepID=UPI00181535C4|nr:carbohydrate ABC transporter permease [Hamadaea sp.]NUR70373.1 carbohydrate ABC transporter permease [Hamadaea sp.]NUT20533.1 carbohydrate ABC transporter permease [Hamadaea sp.]
MTAVRPKWQEPPRPVTSFAKAVTVVVVLALVTVPFLVVVSTSLADPRDVVANGGWVIWPERPSLAAYREILNGGIVGRATLVSLAVTIVGTALSLTCTVLLAYALSRPGVYGGKPLMLLVLFTFLFPPGIIPAYLVVKETGLLNAYAALIAPVLVNTFNLVVMRGFFQSLPSELYEAARLDGASEWKMLWRITIPLSRAVLAVIGLFYAVSYWNSWFHALLYLDDPAKWPLQLVLRTYVLAGGQLADPSAGEAGLMSAPQTVQMAVVVLATIPIVLVYPFLQRFFVRGVLAGAIKT